MLYDAHNHVQDERLNPWRVEIQSAVRGVRMVVNGTSEKDWQAVLDCAEAVPSLGLHPWFVRERTPDWRKILESHLASRQCGIGEIGLDRWMRNPDPAQEEVFVAQLDLAAKRNLPASIHCLQAWGHLYDLLSTQKLPACGFLLHSYNGPVEMVQGFLDLGAYFSISGYFAHPRKAKQRDTFRTVPFDRLLIETDAPDMLPPDEFNGFDLGSLNHPANIANIYRFVSEFLGKTHDDLAAQVERNFQALFGPLLE